MARNLADPLAELPFGDTHLSITIGLKNCVALPHRRDRISRMGWYLWLGCNSDSF
jgi:hypothetical protein